MQSITLLLLFCENLHNCNFVHGKLYRWQSSGEMKCFMWVSNMKETFVVIAKIFIYMKIKNFLIQFHFAIQLLINFNQLTIFHAQLDKFFVHVSLWDKLQVFFMIWRNIFSNMHEIIIGRWMRNELIGWRRKTQNLFTINVK
jgi:hypothetical protein